MKPEKYRTLSKLQDQMDKFHQQAGGGDEEESLARASVWTKYKLYLWLFLEEPFVSPLATMVSCILIALNLVAMVLAAEEQ